MSQVQVNSAREVGEIFRDIRPGDFVVPVPSFAKEMGIPVKPYPVVDVDEYLDPVIDLGNSVTWLANPGEILMVISLPAALAGQTFPGILKQYQVDLGL